MIFFVDRRSAPVHHLQLLNIDVYAPVLGLVPYVEGDDDGDIALEELRGKVEIALQVSGIYYIDGNIAVVEHLDGDLLGLARRVKAV